ncbi:type II toxin-antitoxin system RatA family toxin [Xanthobacter tagetidis]|uniref:Type II toxin-antitoxin system RatA family toxin n=1 Tax=Xanthobacter tagetidis TaxID=60216 RepID=A0A3L7AE43_9HYPH|nr:type II toxin-antitoxin system RatA family toxin [Xanthobacter tagetidis]MBB6309734.1 coenzyme Q-binding protein COQ10 [Xanthobacter tagetidis]RLP78234.1 type II toxin-antitoxin system RatA family toxin [Xanthobacter tagetidis]
MPAFSSSRTVAHSAADMFDLVADVERYPEFVPLCQSLRIKRRTKSDEGVEVLVADMTVAYKLIRETFTSRVTLDRPRLVIHVEYLDGPFSRLDNRWEFLALGERRSEVKFHISYEFRSRALGLVMGAMFDAAFRRFADAFEARADAIYGAKA